MDIKATMKSIKNLSVLDKIFILIVIVSIATTVTIYAYEDEREQEINYISIKDDPTLDLPWEKTFSDALYKAKKFHKPILVHLHLQDKSIVYEEGYNTPEKEHKELWMDAYFQLFVMGNTSVKEVMKERFVLLRLPYPANHSWNGIHLKDPTVVLLYDPHENKIIKQESIRYTTFAPDYMGTTTKEEEITDIEKKISAFLSWLEAAEK